MILNIKDRITIILLFLNAHFNFVKNKYETVVQAAHEEKNIFITARGLRNIINKWRFKSNFVCVIVSICQKYKCILDLVGNVKKTNESNKLISNTGVLALNKALLDNKHATCKTLKSYLVFEASSRTICRYINKLGWKKIRTRLVLSVIINFLLRLSKFCV